MQQQKQHYFALREDLKLGDKVVYDCLISHFWRSPAKALIGQRQQHCQDFDKL